MTHSEVRLTKPGETIVLQNIACLITMDNTDAESPCECDDRSQKVMYKVDVVVEDGVVRAIQPTGSNLGSQVEVVDASRWTVLPGLIDAHNHPVFGGSRARETVLKAHGLSYEEIAKKGGGITASMKSTREASQKELVRGFVERAQTALARGVVMMDAKTGYGLSPDEEVRQLDVILEGIASEPRLPRIVPCVLGPHAASPNYQSLSAFIQALVEALPRFAERIQTSLSTGLIPSASVDIFVERNYFTREHAEHWLGSALQYGFDVHVHADEFSRSGGVDVAVALASTLEQTWDTRRETGRVLSVDHCQYTTNDDYERLRACGIAATVLPATSFFSGLPYVDARHWRASGVRVAIGTDFNPGSAPMNNLWFSAFLALTRGGFTVPEVLAGITRNAAFALGAEATHGMIISGRPANLVAFEGTQVEDVFASPLGDHVRFVLRSTGV